MAGPFLLQSKQSGTKQSCNWSRVEASIRAGSQGPISALGLTQYDWQTVLISLRHTLCSSSAAEITVFLMKHYIIGIINHHGFLPCRKSFSFTT